MECASPALLESNRRLYALRERLAAQPGNYQWPVAMSQPLSSGDQHSAATGRPAAASASSPTVRCQGTAAREQKPAPGHEPPTAGSHIKLYPDVALGMLRNESAAAGRIWLLLKHLDKEGRGWLRIDLLKQALTNKNSKLRVCGRRQLRNLLREGRGVYWKLERGRARHNRIWLMSVAKVAAALGVRQLTGRPVALPIQALLSGIGDVRAHFYASFHSGRSKGAEQQGGGVGPVTTMPIARATLAARIGIGRRTQRSYEARIGLKTRSNFAVGERASEGMRQERAWRQCRALFQLVDCRGHQGGRGRVYLAWQLPNSYSSVHGQQPRGRQKRINRELADLFMKGMTGNGKDAGGHKPSTGSERLVKRYHTNGALAAKAYNRNPGQDTYWRREETATECSASWHVLPASGMRG